jgi:peptide/nickel transport system ATP-binding protein
VVKSPFHPYTKGLMDSIPRLDDDFGRLVQISGSMPQLSAIPKGCAFHPRCSRVFTRCVTERPSRTPQGRSEVACWLYESGPVSAGGS